MIPLRYRFMFRKNKPEAMVQAAERRDAQAMRQIWASDPDCQLFDQAGVQAVMKGRSFAVPTLLAAAAEVLPRHELLAAADAFMDIACKRHDIYAALSVASKMNEMEIKLGRGTLFLSKALAEGEAGDALAGELVKNGADIKIALRSCEETVMEQVGAAARLQANLAHARKKSASYKLKAASHLRVVP